MEVCVYEYGCTGYRAVRLLGAGNVWQIPGGESSNRPYPSKQGPEQMDCRETPL